MDPERTQGTGRRRVGRPGRGLAIVLGVIVVAGVLGGCLGYAAGHDHRGVEPAPIRSAAPHTALLPPLAQGIVGPAHAAAAAASPVGLPARLRIAAIGVNSSLERLGRLPDGTLEAPREWGQAGWYADGVRPGAQGPAVIAGHVDSTDGPAVFFRLRELRPGDIVVVSDTNGATFRFRVDHTMTYPKSRFPSTAVYGPTALAQLRLVTCTGQFDRMARSYRENLVVYADLVS
jgi:hypothetical protein